MAANRVGFWQSHFGWALELGYRLMANIFGDNFPVPAGPALEPPSRAPVAVARRPHARRCHENHDRPSDQEAVSHITPPTERVLRSTLAIALRRLIQLCGLIQYVAEITGFDRYTVVYSYPEAKIGVINHRLRTEHPVLFAELQRCLDVMETGFADETDPVMEDFSRAIVEQLIPLNSVDYGGNVVPQVRDKLKPIQEDCLYSLKRFGGDKEEVSSFTFHQLFYYGQQGYRMCYYDIERAEQGA